MNVPHLFPYSSVEEYLGCFYLLGIVNNAAVYMGFESLLSILLVISSEVKFLDHRVILCLLF